MNKLFNLVSSILLIPVIACTDISAVDPDQDPALQSTDSSALEAIDGDVVTNAGTGGCTGARPISSCISRQGNSVLGDFYMNVPPDSSYWSYTVDITRSNLGTVRVASGRIDHQGHYGAWGANIATLPISRGCATTVVRVFTSAGTFHLSNTSPQVCY